MLRRCLSLRCTAMIRPFMVMNSAGIFSMLRKSPIVFARAAAIPQSRSSQLRVQKMKTKQILKSTAQKRKTSDPQKTQTRIKFKTMIQRPNAFIIFVQIMKGKIPFSQHGLNSMSKRSSEMARLYRRLRPDQRIVLAQHAHDSIGKRVPISSWMQYCEDERNKASRYGKKPNPTKNKNKQYNSVLPNIYDLSLKWRRDKEIRAFYTRQYMKRCEQLLVANKKRVNDKERHTMFKE